MTNQSNDRPTIAVVGATGQQGGATADALLDASSRRLMRTASRRPVPLPGRVPLQMVATRDIGQVAAVALLDPDRIACGGAVEIAATS